MSIINKHIAKYLKQKKQVEDYSNLLGYDYINTKNARTMNVSNKVWYETQGIEEAEKENKEYFSNLLGYDYIKANNSNVVNVSNKVWYETQGMEEADKQNNFKN